MREAHDPTARHWIRLQIDCNNGNISGCIFSRPHSGRTSRDDHVDAIGREFLGEYRESGRHFFSDRPYNFDVEIIAASLITQSLTHRGNPQVRGLDQTGMQETKPGNPGAPLGQCWKWPCNGRPAQTGNELPTPHSITSSARASSEVGTVRPIALATLTLTTSSNLVDCSTEALQITLTHA